MRHILIAGNNHNFKVTETASCGHVLMRGLSQNFKVSLSTSLLKTFKLSAGVDAILALSPTGVGYAGYLSARFRKKKFFIRIDDDYAWRASIEGGKTYLLVGDFQKSKKSGRMGALHKRQVQLCARAELVIVPSKFMSAIVCGWGINKEKIKIINDAVESREVSETKEEARRKIGISGNLLLSAGSLVSWNGFRMLVKIMPQLTGINQFLRLVIVGDGPEYKTLKAMIKNTSLDKKIYLVRQKNQEELAWFFAAADIFIFNSGHAPFPHNTIKAMACGIPVITTAVGANSEIIRQGENGFMVKYNDEFNLIEAIKTVWQMPELRERFIEEGKKTAARFNQERMIEETIQAISYKL